MASTSLRGSVLGSAATVMVVLTVAVVVVMLPQVSSLRYIVGAPNGWTANENYTLWAQGKHFYNGDWLYFVYDRNKLNVLEVNKTDYEGCISDHPIHNWTTGAGRDVVPLNITKDYYFISGKGFCFHGVKLAIHVENPPPSPSSSSPENNDAAAPVQPPLSGGAVFVENPLSSPSSSPEKNAAAGTVQPPLGGRAVHVESPTPPPSSSPQKTAAAAAATVQPRLGGLVLVASMFTACLI